MSTVAKCINCFELLSNHHSNWSEVWMVDTFIEGLQLKIQQEVKARRPRKLARIEEERLDEETCKKFEVAIVILFIFYLFLISIDRNTWIPIILWSVSIILQNLIISHHLFVEMPLQAVPLVTCCSVHQQDIQL